MSITELRNLTPQDIFEEAVAASRHDDSDEDDPFGPQPKRFMQTEHQKRRQERELYVRQVAKVLRNKLKARRQRSKEQCASLLDRLPPELILCLMRHTHVDDLLDFANSNKINRTIFKANKIAILRGIEIEQFPEWKWLFGETTCRSLAQSQHLKDAMSVEYYSIEIGKAWSEKLLEIMRLIDNNKFTGMQYLVFLQELQDRVDNDIKATESYTKKKITRRTAICLRSFSFQRPEIVKEEDRTEDGPVVESDGLSWEARSQLVSEQPASTKAEIKSLFEIVIEDFSRKLQGTLIHCTRYYYKGPTCKPSPQKAKAVKRWMSKLVTGLIIELVITQWWSQTTDSRLYLVFTSEMSMSDLADRLLDLFPMDDGEVADALQEVEDDIAFGESLGLDLEGLVDGTAVGKFIDSRGPSGDEERREVTA